jgi:hypothetical protein
MAANKRRRKTLLLDELVRYEGTVDAHGRRSGRGTLIITDEDDGSVSRILGEWDDDELHGPAVYTAPDGSTVHGSYTRGSLEGLVLELANDETICFVGSYADGVRSGVGIEVRADGGCLEGPWVEGSLHGSHCAYHYPCAQSGALLGEWREGCMVRSRYVRLNRATPPWATRSPPRAHHAMQQAPEQPSDTQAGADAIGLAARGEESRPNPSDALMTIELLALRGSGLGRAHLPTTTTINPIASARVLLLCDGRPLPALPRAEPGGARYSYGPGTREGLPAFPALADPHEAARVEVRPSAIPAAGLGLWARTELVAGEVVAFYAGLKIGRELADARRADAVSHALVVDEDEGVDVPAWALVAGAAEFAAASGGASQGSGGHAVGNKGSGQAVCSPGKRLAVRSQGNRLAAGRQGSGQAARSVTAPRPRAISAPGRARGAAEHEAEQEGREGEKGAEPLHRAHYLASSAHYANHSFSSNCEYAPYNHPRFGPIVAVRVRPGCGALRAGCELTVDYPIHAEHAQPESGVEESGAGEAGAGETGAAEAGAMGERETEAGEVGARQAQRGTAAAQHTRTAGSKRAAVPSVRAGIPEWFLRYQHMRTEDGYYYHLRMSPPRDLIRFRAGPPEHGGGIVARAHGPWRVLNLGRVEQGMTFCPQHERAGCPPCPSRVGRTATAQRAHKSDAQPGDGEEEQEEQEEGEGEQPPPLIVCDPSVIGFEYVRTAAAAALVLGELWRRPPPTPVAAAAGAPDLAPAVAAAAEQLVAVGLGAGSLPLFFKHHCPWLRVRALELYPLVAEVAREHLGNPLPFETVFGDGAVALKRMAAEPARAECERAPAGRAAPSGARTPPPGEGAVSADATCEGEASAGATSAGAACIFLDAYDSRGQVPAHLQQPDFLADCAAHLRPRGVLVANVWNGPAGSAPFARMLAFARAAEQAVGPVFAVPVRGQEANLVLVSLRRALNGLATDGADGPGSVSPLTGMARAAADYARKCARPPFAPEVVAILERMASDRPEAPNEILSLHQLLARS